MVNHHPEVGLAAAADRSPLLDGYKQSTPRNDPDSEKRLGPAPCVDPSARVREARFGVYCEVGARTRVAESEVGDYGYVANDADI